jgi:hypothetical protein
LADTLSFLDASGGSFTSTYNADNGLTVDGNNKMVALLGLVSLPPASYAIDYFFTVLAASPILAVIMYSTNSNIAHMVVISDITGDRTPGGTNLVINDPLPLNTGHTYPIAFSDFLAKFESVVSFEDKLGLQNLMSQLFFYPSANAINTSAAATGGAGEAGTADGSPAPS